MKVATMLWVIAALVALWPPSAAHAAAVYYHPNDAYAADDNKEGILSSFDAGTGSIEQVFDASLRRAGVPADMTLAADESEETCEYKIWFDGKRYEFVRQSASWSMRFEKDLQLFIVDTGSEHASANRYLDKRFRFSIITMGDGAPTEQLCTIVPGDKLGLAPSKTGNGAPNSLTLVVERIAERVASGQLSARDYSCNNAVPAG